VVGRKTIYLDHNATTPCAPEVVQAMIPFFSGRFGNYSSPHRMGRDAATAVEQARQQLAMLIGCEPAELVFTSGATESNNIALLGVAAAATDRRKIVTSAVEHTSVLGPCEFLSAQGFRVIRLPVDRRGVVDTDAAARAVDDRTLIVSIQAANNETGTIQPIQRIAQIAREHGAVFHSDCAQVLGKLPLEAGALDLASFSSHKMYGPKGVGALFINRMVGRLRPAPVHHGGGHEQALRPGTLNTPGIVGFGEACRLSQLGTQEEALRLSGLRDLFERTVMSSMEEVVINGAIDARLPGSTSLTVRDVPADVLIANLPTVCISHGSACSSGAHSPSHVLLAMGLSRRDAGCTVRAAFGRFSTDDDAHTAGMALVRAARRVRQASRVERQE